MKKFTFAILTTLLIGTFSSTAQDDPKHKNYYKSIDPVETEIYEISFKDMVSRMDYNKFAFKLKNLTNDFIILRKEESAFVIDGKKHHDKEKEIIIKPNKNKAGTFNVTGDANLHADKFTFDLGGIYILPAEGKIHEAPNFALPAAKNEIKFGDFKVKLKKLKKETQETIAAFEITYTGKDYAIVDPTKLAITIPEKGEQEFANDAKGAQAKILKQGKKIQIRAVFHIPAKYKDMQFANMEILWKDMFQSSKPSETDNVSIDFELDEGLTEGKN